MKINISEVEEVLDLDLSEHLAENSPLKTTGPVCAHFRIEKIDDGLHIQGNITGTIVLQCSRCLTDFDRGLSLDIDLIYHPANTLKRGEEHRAFHKDESNIEFYSGDELDITDIMKEQLIFQIPIKPLCDEKCKGICPVCGTDLNFQECNCSMEYKDPRFAVLRDLTIFRKED